MTDDQNVMVREFFRLLSMFLFNFSFQNELVFWCLMSIFLAVCFLIDLLSVISKIMLFGNWCFHVIFEFFKLQPSFRLIW